MVELTTGEAWEAEQRAQDLVPKLAYKIGRQNDLYQKRFLEVDKPTQGTGAEGIEFLAYELAVQKLKEAPYKFTVEERDDRWTIRW